MTMTMTMKITYCQSCTERNMWPIQYIWYYRMFKKQARWIIIVVIQFWKWEQKWYLCAPNSFQQQFYKQKVSRNRVHCAGRRTIGENRIVNKNQDRRKISSCIWKWLLHNQGILHDRKNSIILLFYSIMFQSSLCSSCSSVLNIQQIGLSSRMIMNTLNFYEHVFEQRKKQVFCQFIHKQCYRIISYFINVQNFQIFM